LQEGSATAPVVGASALNDTLLVATSSYGNFAPLLNAFDTTHNGGWDQVIMKIAPDGTPVWAGYLGGGDTDNATAISPEVNGSFTVSGISRSGNFPTVNPYQSSNQGVPDCVITEISAQGTPLWSTYFGGSSQDGGTTGVSPSGETFLAGTTSSTNFPITNAFIPVLTPNSAAYLAKFSPAKVLEFSTFIQGTPLVYSFSQTSTISMVATAGGEALILGGSYDQMRNKIPFFPQRTQQTGIGMFLLLLDASGSIPVELSAFNARVNGTTVYLTWSTESETANAGFEVQRSLTPARDGWETRAFVEGTGTTRIRQEYAMADEVPSGLPVHQSVYYRLKQIDTDGRVHYSTIIEAQRGETPENFAILDVHPQPSNGEISIRFGGSGGDVALRLVDMLGRTVLTRHLVSRSSVSLDLSSTPAGAYTLIADQGSARAVRRILLR
jgi:hypothetical protein